MNALGELSSFFYNIIPGILFLFALHILHGKEKIFSLDDLPKTDIFYIFITIIVGAAIGFFFQAVSKFVIKDPINKKVADELANCVETKVTFAKVKKHMSGFGIKDNLGILYAMDNKLRNNEPSYTINNFAERAAFWINISLGSAVLGLLELCKNGLYYSAPFFLIGLISFFLFKKSVKSHYHSVLNTFVQDMDHEVKNSRKR